MIKRLLLISLILIISCAKEDSQSTDNPPYQITKNYTLSVTAGEGGSVSTTGGTFSIGTEISITATPNEGYVFTSWSNGSTENPIKITLSSNIELSANFEIVINYFSFSLLISEGGSVSSSIGSPVTGTYEEGTEITLIANAYDGYQFMGWSDGNLLAERSILIDSNVEIEALFDLDCSYWQYEVPDWKKTSYELFDIIYPENWQQAGNLLLNQWGNQSGEYGLNVIVVDYNNDGYRDVIGFYNDYSNFVEYPQDYFGYERKQMIRFYKGICGGGFEIDELNDNKILGTVHGRKVLLADFNEDGYVDIFFVSHGYDNIPFKGEYSKAIFSDGSGGYYDVEYQEYVSFYHGGATGDIDNDGDLDVVVVEGGRGKSLVYINNGGVLTPSTNLIDQDLAKSMYNAELFDLNNDGYLDLIMGGHDWENHLSTSYDTLPLVVYGDGIDFINNDYIRLPEANIGRQGLVSNFEFYDLNNDGNVEIILTRTGDGLGEEPNLPWNERNFYKNWSVQVLELNGNQYLDKTNEFIDVYYGNEPWIKFTKIRDKDNDGNLEMFNNVNPYNDLDNYLEWKIISGKLLKQ